MRAGAFGLTLVDAMPGLAVDAQRLRPKTATPIGGLSGPALKPIALAAVYQVARAMPDVPVMGVGGISTGLDAVEFLLAGASAVEVGGKIYIAGSYNSVVALLEYDPATRTYSRKTDLPGTRYAFFFGGIDNRVYVAGGDNGGMWPDSMLGDLHEYNPSTNAWTLKSAAMPMANAYGASASAKRRFFAIGGWADDYTTTFAYHPESDSWETLARMPSPSWPGSAS